ncbi:MAG: 4Fe-4S binding protein [Spirochaetales bacterium]|nr:4Fe-4S binding protein [Spirochaetales bacterium]
MALQPIIEVDPEACVNCHQCISVCPIKYCMDGSGDSVTINHDTCIGCGNCITACTHNARRSIDDWDRFSRACAGGEKIVAIVAPSAAASFEGQLEKLNGYLRKLGVEAFFDVSFGAELTVKSYLEYIKSAQPQLVIAQPCPAIVNYIELFMPELLPHLAPADSPMLHTMKMIREYYPRYGKHKMAVISPCLAKKREFESTGMGDYNVTFASIEKALSGSGKSLASFASVPYDSPIPERAVLFSSPGGLMATVERDMPEAAARIRKIEGTHTIYDYLNDLPQSLIRNRQPLLVDCLNCEKGCNGGTGTNRKETPVDILEQAVSERVAQQKRLLTSSMKDNRASAKLDKTLSQYWRPDLYVRKYKDRSALTKWKTPSEQEMWAIYNRMFKFSDTDVYNCASCGYGSCEGLVRAIHNGLNKPENCHHYEVTLVKKAHDTLDRITNDLHSKINDCSLFMKSVEQIVLEMKENTIEQGTAIEESSASVEEMLASIKNITKLA